MTAPPHDEPIGVTFFTDAYARAATEAHLSLGELRARVMSTTAATKAGLPWLKLALFGTHATARGSLRNNANVLFICGVEADYDADVMPPAEAVAALERAGLAGLVYTSPSHSATRNRWRVLGPTSEWLPPDARRALVGRLNAVLGGVLSTESFTLSQAYFYGSVGSNAHHGAWVVAGRCIDLATDLTAEAYPAPVRPVAVPVMSGGLPPDQHALAALERAAAMLQDPAATGQRHPTLLAAALLLAPMVKSGHIAEAVAVSALHDAMEASGRTPNDGEVESAVAGAARFAVAYWEPTGGSEFDYLAELIPSVRTLPLIHPADCETGPRRGYIVKHLVAPGDVGAIIGPPSTGKSMLAPYLAYAVAQGRPVFGLRVKAGRTLYVAAEDFTGMRQRVHALKLRHGDAPDFALAEVGNLREPLNVTTLRDTVTAYQPALVVIDTLGAAWAGLDENSSQDMGAVVAVARALAAQGCAVLLIHHIAKHGDGTPRGHSVLNGTLDMSLRLEPADEGGIIRGVLGKNRNGSTDRAIAFRYEAMTLGQDDDGDDVTAPLAIELAGASAGRQRPDKLPKAARSALHTLRSMVASDPGCGGQVDEAAWRARCDDERIVSQADNTPSRERAFRRAYAELMDTGIVGAGEGKVWVVCHDFDDMTADRADKPGQSDVVRLNAA